MWHFVDGYVIIQCNGKNLPRFLNLLRASGILAQNVSQRQDGGMTLSMRARDFLRIRPLVRQSGCKVHILKRDGLPFLVWRLRRRPVLWVGMLAVMGAMIFASTRILHIRVTGCNRLPEALVLRALAEQGVERFGPYPQANLEQIGSLMRLYDARIAWVSLELIGNCLSVAVTEMEPSVSAVDSDAPCDVVAVKDGVISSMEVYAGNSSLRPGDAVAAGDVLICGEYFPKTNEMVEAPMRVHARGKILARVGYFSEYAAEPTEMALTETGNRLPYRRISLWGVPLSQTRPPYAEYEIRDVTVRPFGDGPLPIEVAQGVCCELANRPRTRTREEQTELALSTAEQQAYLKIPKDAAIVEKQQRILELDGVVIAVVGIVTEETIGLERPFS